MFQSPIAPAPDPETPASEPGEELHALAFDPASARLRESHLHNGQVQARALFAPFLGMTALRRRDDRRLGDARRGAGRAGGRLGGGRSPSPIGSRRGARWRPPPGDRAAARAPAPTWLAVAEAVGLAALWAALPTWAFATQPIHVQLVIGGVMAGMTTAAIAFAAIPAAAIAWIATLTAAFCVAYYLGGAALDPKIGLTYMLIAAAGAFSVTRLTRWIFGQMEEIALTRTQAEFDPPAAQRI